MRDNTGDHHDNHYRPPLLELAPISPACLTSLLIAGKKKTPSNLFLLSNTLSFHPLLKKKMKIKVPNILFFMQ